MAGKSAVEVIARHFLTLTNIAAVALAESAFSARQDSRYNDRFTLKIWRPLQNDAGNFMAQNQGHLMAGRNTVMPEADIGMTHSASGYFYECLIRFNGCNGDLHLFKWGILCRHLVTDNIHSSLLFVETNLISISITAFILMLDHFLLGQRGGSQGYRKLRTLHQSDFRRIPERARRKRDTEGDRPVLYLLDARGQVQ